MDDLVQKQIFGVVRNYHYVIEFQKKGLPHAHSPFTMHPNDKIIDVPAVDHIIYAYIPDIYTQPNVYRLVKDFYIHTTCGRLNPDALCMQDNKCKKYYP
ncbi:unnamed protein product [Psylliodes chrysocephalus]|uniref:Helitron helicase-like domain-containing protein n=1 Tax=Psylliodes chrysocephalus TaxID=3402493 RepID=A0A9P0GLR2_9CUCU|nr:unnamed protein product [Psylliodes chrysocephala]